jgi:hypothetical protein
VVAVRLLLLLLQPLLLSLTSAPLSPLQLLLPAQNTQRQRAAGPREVLHPLTVLPLRARFSLTHCLPTHRLGVSAVYRALFI